MRIFVAPVETIDRGGQLIRRAAFDRTGVTQYGADEVRPGWFLCVAQGIDAAPAGTWDCGNDAQLKLDWMPRGQQNQLASSLGITRDELVTYTPGELIVAMMDADPNRKLVGRDGFYTISLAGVELFRQLVVAGGAVEIDEPFTYSNGALTTVASADWAGASNFTVASNLVNWPTNEAAGIVWHQTELSSADCEITCDVAPSTASYAAMGPMVRGNNSTGSPNGYRAEFATWLDGTTQFHFGITRYDAGSTTEVATSDEGTPDTAAHDVRIEVSGNTINCYLDGAGTPNLSYGSATSYTTNKFVGMYGGRWYGNTPTLDNYIATTAGGATAVTGTKGSSATASDTANIDASANVTGTKAASATAADTANVDATATIAGTKASSASASATASLSGTAAVTGTKASSASAAGTATLAVEAHVTGTKASSATAAGTGALEATAAIAGTKATSATASDIAGVSTQVTVSGTKASSATASDTAALTATATIAGTKASSATASDAATLLAAALITGTKASSATASDVANIGGATNIPQNVVATATGGNTVTVTWDTVPSALYYDVERDGQVIAVNHAASPYLDSGLDPGTLYTYRVRSVLAL